MRAQTFRQQRYDISICGILLEIRKVLKKVCGCGGEVEVYVKETGQGGEPSVVL